jgi:hypothetical protein
MALNTMKIIFGNRNNENRSFAPLGLVVFVIQNQGASPPAIS